MPRVTQRVTLQVYDSCPTAASAGPVCVTDTMLAVMSTSLHHRAIEHLGTRIVAGELPAGHVMLAEHLEGELKVSRSVVREAVRVLQSLGMVETIKRVGIRVLPASRWNPFDPLVIRWRLAGDGRGAQLRSLAELRTAVEPVAAELAAINAPEALRRELVEISGAMRRRARPGTCRGSSNWIFRFHSLLLTGSGNEMFANLVGQVAEDPDRTDRPRTHAGPPWGNSPPVACGRRRSNRLR